MPLHPLEGRVLDCLDFSGLLEFLAELIRIPSVGGAETPAQLEVAAWMREKGMDVDVWELDFDQLMAHPAYSAEVHREEGLGVVGAIGRATGGRDLILNGHVDVVPPGDLSNWGFPPWECRVEDGRVWGRGALDMKGGLVAGLFAADAIQKAGIRLKGRRRPRMRSRGGRQCHREVPIDSRRVVGAGDQTEP